MSPDGLMVTVPQGLLALAGFTGIVMTPWSPLATRPDALPGWTNRYDRL